MADSISSSPSRSIAGSLHDSGISPRESYASKELQGPVSEPPHTRIVLNSATVNTSLETTSIGQDQRHEKDSRDNDIDHAHLDTQLAFGETGRTEKESQSQNLHELGGFPKYKTQKTPNRLDGVAALIDLSPARTARGKIQQEIATYTAARRNRFFVHTKHFWLPLLPRDNFVQSLVDQYAQLSPAEVARLPSVYLYEELQDQPRGVKAKMKPYQLSGLSFLIYLHRNAIAGILGDEMGLGKTLQTLALFQYLKQDEPRFIKGSVQRPSLVLCPLSVLSSWMAEAKKWTPNLKVIRFHGPAIERNRLKKVVIGEHDFNGNLTAYGMTRSNVGRKVRDKIEVNAQGQEIISLLSDDEQDASDVGVDLVVTTYDAFRSEQSWFKRVPFVWRYVVLDEGHTIKNHQSLVSKSLQTLRAEYRLVLSGTPLQNNLTELWSILHWLYPEVFTEKTQSLFDNSFNLSKGHFSSAILDSSRRLLELIMLRRLKTSVGVDLQLPPKTEIIMYVPLSPIQQFWYKRMITKTDSGLLDELFRGLKDKKQKIVGQEAAEANVVEARAPDSLSEHLSDNVSLTTDLWRESQDILKRTILREDYDQGDVKKRSHWRNLMNLVMRLRQVSNHPYQIEGAEPSPYYLGEHVIAASGKFIVLEKMVNELVVQNHKRLLIFSGFTGMLDLVEELLKLRGGDGSSFRFARIDGSTCRARRNLSIRLVNDLSSDYRVMLISTRAGGLGINLTAASEVVLLDADWNPQVDLQAESRAHRIGQLNAVSVYKLIAHGTVEEQMMGRIRKKLYLSAKVTETMADIHTKTGETVKSEKAKKSAGDTPDLSVSQLMTMVRRGASALSRPAVDVHTMLKWNWSETLAHCKDQRVDASLQRDVAFDSEAEHKWLSEMEKVESTIFDGEALLKDRRSEREVTEEQFSQTKAERRIGKNRTVEIDGFAVDKSTLHCKAWEAVKTIADDGRFADAKREKATFESQSHCQVCFDGGTLICCQLCPRAYHFDCLESGFQAKAKSKSWQFHCPQHQCDDCEQRTVEAGGMLFRCRWCERSFCEDCLSFERAELIGDTLMELELLGFGETTPAYWVQCHNCTNHFEEHAKDKKLCDDLAVEWKEEWERKRRPDQDAAATSKGTGMISGPSTRGGSMTDASSVETSGVATPTALDTLKSADDMIVNGDEQARKQSLRSTSAGKRSLTSVLTNTSVAKKAKLA